MGACVVTEKHSLVSISETGTLTKFQSRCKVCFAGPSMGWAGTLSLSYIPSLICFKNKFCLQMGENEKEHLSFTSG